MALMEEFKHLRIPLDFITTATNNFAENKVIGKGGFGKVYEGVVPHSKGLTLVAIKRLDRSFGQGDPEFWKEIMMLSRYRHTNLISLLGYCDEGVEKIVVYEHALNGSLDRHLSSRSLTWTQRIKICLDAARGLKYLHDHKGTQQRVIHRDIKSSNILLDEKWIAKVSDMGLSKIGPANQKHTSLFTNVVGTLGYIDPQYMKTYALTKESDIYSFGVVLLEVLCGRLCYKRSNGHVEILVPMWKKNYKCKKLESIIFEDLEKMHPSALEAFADIAFQCLKRSREKRPTISQLVEKLQTALEFQERHDLKAEYEQLMLLSNKVFLNGEKMSKRCTRAMAVGVVEASCEEIFELVMNMDGRRYEWDCSFQYGSLVEEVDGHTAILYHRLQFDWFPTIVWPRDLCYMRYWCRNDDGSYLVLFRSKEHKNCGPQPGFVRAHIESGGFSISPLKPRNRQPITKVQHHMQIDLKGWGVGSVSSFQQHCLRQMLNSVDGLQEFFSQTDERTASQKTPVKVNLSSSSVTTKKTQKVH